MGRFEIGSRSINSYMVSSSSATVTPFRAAPTSQGVWLSSTPPEPLDSQTLRDALRECRRPIFLVDDNGRLAVARGGQVVFGEAPHHGSNPHHAAGRSNATAYPLKAWAPPLGPANLGDARFKADNGLRYAYISGAMANGITSVAMVAAMARAGMLGFFGAAGMPPVQVEAAIDELNREVPQGPVGFNLIHSPFDPDLEAAIVDLYLRRGVTRVSASAYINLTLPLVYYRLKGIHRDGQGRVVCPNRIVGKVSRVEVAQRFLSPPPAKLVIQLRDQNHITAEEAELAATIPMADDLTAEADSGGHTDNRPAIALLPTMLALRDQLHQKHGYQRKPCVGLGGGIATPYAAAAAFAMGAAYVVVGTVNQSCVEAGTSAHVRQLLTTARQGDVTMAPSADMFELGVKVQVLKRGTMFPLRAQKLYDLYSNYDAFEQIPPTQRQMVERDILQESFEMTWQHTEAFFRERDPRQITRAQTDPKHKMALVFRSYLGQASRWAQAGDPDRRMDYQVWCGPAMGAFNQWVQGTYLADAAQRDVTTVALNFLLGAAVLSRTSILQSQGVSLPEECHRFAPMPLDNIRNHISNGFHSTSI